MDSERKSLVEDLWIVRIFSAEFGFSDVLANYSRTYAWMANQLGHMALGLGLALVCAAIVDTLQAARLMRHDYGGWMAAGFAVSALADGAVVADLRAP